MSTEVKCAWCNLTFERPNKRANENFKKGFNSFCCKEHRLKYSSWKQSDEYSFYRKFMHRIKEKCRERNWKTDLTLSDLHSIMESQEQKCPYTGQTMLFVRENNPNQVSLDRKDSNLPYTKDNVEFISLIAQYAKNVFTSDQLLEFCERVYEHRIKTNN